MWKATILLAILLAGTRAQAAGWPDITNSDLTEIHRLMADNHPGPADPQNPGYKVWLEKGLGEARARAATASTFADYKRALQYYVTGFRDGHIDAVFTVDSVRQAWPGFLPRLNDAGGFEIGLSEEAGAPVGARLVGCDGKSAQALFEERVLPYTWNRDIPHKKIGLAPLLLMLDRSDMAARFSTCEIETAQGPQTINLRWRSVSAEQGAELRRSTLGFVVPEQGLRRVGDVWILSLTSFDIQPGAPTEAFRALLEEVRAKAPELRRSTLIVDVRGNHGGNSEWAVNFAKAIWGDAWVDRVTGSFDDSIDWRASADNLKGLEVNLDRNRSQNLSEGFRYWSEARDLMKAAMAKGEPLARQGQPGKPLSKTPPPSLITGKVFFLTDYTCFSSCLLFADIVRRMPGVTHIGLPTDADTAYEDNTAGYLPSGMGALSYSMKVYRHRLRKTNEWYEPQFRWPGGPMTDEAVVKWVGALSKPQ